MCDLTFLERVGRGGVGNTARYDEGAGGAGFVVAYEVRGWRS